MGLLLYRFDLKHVAPSEREHFFEWIGKNAWTDAYNPVSAICEASFTEPFDISKCPAPKNAITYRLN